MPEIALRLNAPNRSWAEHIRALIQEALGEGGSAQIQLPPEVPEGSIEPPGYELTGMAICNEPLEEYLEAIKAKLIDYDVSEEEMTADVVTLVIKPN